MGGSSPSRSREASGVMGLSATILMRTEIAQRRPVILSLATSAAIQGLNALTGILLARSLGLLGRGDLAAILLWPGILAAVGSLGVTEAVTYETAAGSSPVRAIVGSSLIIATIQSIALIGIGAVIAPIVHNGRDTQVLYSTYLYLAYIPLNLITLCAIGVLNGLQQYLAYHTLRLMVIALMALGLVLLAAYQALTVRAAIVAYLAANMLTAVSALLLLQRQGVLSLTCRYETIRRLFGFGLRSHTTNVASLLNERLDQLVISIFLAPAKLGLYVIAVTMTSATTFIGSATAMVVFPVVASLRNPTERMTAATRYVRWILVGATCTAVPLIALTPLLIQVLFGKTYLDAVPVTRVLFAASVFLCTNYVVGAVLKAVGRPLDAGIAECLSLGVTAVGLVLLLPWLELIGAALTSLLAYCATTVWLTLRAARALEITPLHLLLPTARDRKPLGD
jgi:O-antigen/teichoic acid export membrane protein